MTVDTVQQSITTLQRQMQAQAAEASEQTARLGARNAADGQAMCDGIAREVCPEQLAKLESLLRWQHELGAELQEAQHELRALGQLEPKPGDEEAHDQRGAALTWRVQRLGRQIAQLGQERGPIEATIIQAVARALEHANRMNKQRHNALEREKSTKIQALMEQVRVTAEEYDRQQGALQQDRHRYMAAASTLGTQVNLGELDRLATGLFRDVE